MWGVFPYCFRKSRFHPCPVPVPGKDPGARGTAGPVPGSAAPGGPGRGGRSGPAGPTAALPEVRGVGGAGRGRDPLFWDPSELWEPGAGRAGLSPAGNGTGNGTGGESEPGLARAELESLPKLGETPAKRGEAPPKREQTPPKQGRAFESWSGGVWGAAVPWGHPRGDTPVGTPRGDSWAGGPSSVRGGRAESGRLCFGEPSAGTLGEDQQQGGGRSPAVPTGDRSVAGPEPGLAMSSPLVEALCEPGCVGKQTKPRGRTPAQAGPGRAVSGGSALPIVTFPSKNEWPGAWRGSANPRVSPKGVPAWLSADGGGGDELSTAQLGLFGAVDV